MDHSPSIMSIGKALSVAQGEISNPVRNKDNPFFKTKYVELSSVIDVLRAPFAKNGLSIVQSPTCINEKKELVLETLIMHTSGEWIASSFAIPVSKTDAQACGSAITYARRYVLQAIALISADDDDDAEGAVNREVKSPSKPQQQPEQPPQSKKPISPPQREGIFKGSSYNGTEYSILIAINDREYRFLFSETVGELKTHPFQTWNQLLNRKCLFRHEVEKKNNETVYILKDISFPGQETKDLSGYSAEA